MTMSVCLASDPHTFDRVYDERLLAPAQRVLNGDSANAVRDLEGVLLEDYPGDERFGELGGALALYAPGMGRPTSDGPRSGTRTGGRWTP